MKSTAKIAVFLLLCASFAVSAAGWTRDFAAAQEKAKKENKVILMVFSGTDWCPPCMALEKRVLSRTDFIQKAEKSAVLVLVDFARRKKLPASEMTQRNELAKKYNVGAFPTVFVVSPDGKVLKKQVGAPAGNVDGMLKWLEAAGKK